MRVEVCTSVDQNDVGVRCRLLGQAGYFSQAVTSAERRGPGYLSENIARAGVPANAGQPQEFTLLTFNVSISKEEYFGR